MPAWGAMLVVIFGVFILTITVIMPKINALREAVDRHRFSIRDELLDVQDTLIKKFNNDSRLINGTTHVNDLVCGCRHHLAFHDKRGCQEQLSVSVDEQRRKCRCTGYIGPQLPTTEERTAHEKELNERRLLAESQVNCSGEMPLL